MNFVISTGNSRKDKFWKKQSVTWDEFTEKLSHTTVTSETQAEYRKMKKFQQDNAKDVGGFIAGELKYGRRRKENVISRSMITLDMDYADDAEVTVSNIEMLYDYTCCIYSTHKHTPEKPRLRIIVPLCRPVTADGYQAVSRMIAKQIGIELFDDTTYEPNRLMYWPSTSADGEYFFKVIDGEFLNPDSILSLYKDWKDTSSWPVSSRQTAVIQKAIKKQEDPLEKKGMVGAFCRSYTIVEAIDTFLSDIYAPSIIQDRYDYIPADSSAGVIIYENKYAYSHHATDPACGKLLNSFDLVRIHRYGDMDDGADEKKQLPSYREMVEFCREDEKVKNQLADERMEQAKNEFNNENWQVKLEVNKNGGVKDTLSNITEILRHDSMFKTIAYNELSHRLDVNGEVPWKQVKPGWNDSDLSNAKVLLDKKYGIYSPAKFKDALLTAASERAFHPIKDYFNTLPVWDGTQRVDALLIDYLGAEDNIYTRDVIRKTLAAAVARIYEPGIKFDTVLILIGEQGIGKSTFFSKLAMKWFSDSLTLSDMRDKASAEKLQGYWILELGELAGLRKMDLELVKAFITRLDDKFRHSYGSYVESHPRQCIIVGTTNSEKGILRDVTGNRRYWPVHVGKGKNNIWDDLTQEEVDQIWAETILNYKQKEELILRGEAAVLAYRYQQEAMEEDDREGLVREYLETLLPDNWDKMDLFERRNFLAGESEFGGEPAVGKVKRRRVCYQEIWCECFGKDKSDLKRSISFEIQSILVKIGGWKKYGGNKSGKLKLPIYGSQVTYIRDDK
ncbi:virulence-associated E family protein [Clostridium tyrobutyricum]|uniref:virulence-associated E family protein n=1 Tax=Clostridium tyrobutyricum TaxID=1519 RepID=UPI0010AA82BF|nr:virulence-associated E family protein [Clostridium tyrobutyricum]QCH27820.1 Virulence-associated protein E [Clostridium tyrobutyricum]